jgi:hypothetical protein
MYESSIQTNRARRPEELASTETNSEESTDPSAEIVGGSLDGRESIRMVGGPGSRAVAWRRLRTTSASKKTGRRKGLRVSPSTPFRGHTI